MLYYFNYSVQFSHDGPAVSLLYIFLTESNTVHTHFEHWTMSCCINDGKSDFNIVLRHIVRSGIFYKKPLLSDCANFLEFWTCYKISKTSGVRFEKFFEPTCWKKVSAVRLREMSALERVQLQRNKWNSAGTKFCLPYRGVRLERVDCMFKNAWIMQEEGVTRGLWANLLIYRPLLTYQESQVCKNRDWPINAIDNLSPVEERY